ncbi:MAG: CHAT domain-containing protein [Acidobacteriia bacterium]|nr:CHAT domain-containing protein [Terriglobia bacterium]
MKISGERAMPLSDLSAPTLSPAEWVEKIAHSESPEEIADPLAGWSNPVGLSLVEHLTQEVIRYSRRDPKATMRLAQAAHVVATRLGDPKAMALAERALGNAEQVGGNNRAAAAHYRSSIQRFEALGDEIELARTLSSSVGVLVYLGEYDRGLEEAERAKEIFERYQDEARLARLEVNRGNLYHRLDRFQEAIACYDSALAVLERSGDYEAIAGIKSNQATCLITLNRFEDALKSYREARALCEEHQMPLLVAQADYNISYLYYLRGEYTRALEMLSAAAISFQERNNVQHLALCDLDQAEIYLELNLSRDAIELSERAAERFLQIGMRYERAKAITISATARTQTQEFFKALEMFDQARSLFAAENNLVWMAMVDLYKATIFYSTGRHFEALNLCRTALHHFESQQLVGKAVFTEILMAKISLGLGEAPQAELRAQSATTHLGQVNAPWLNYQAYYTLGLTQEAVGDVAAAEKSYLQAIAVLETMRGNIMADELKIMFFKDKQSVYERLVTLSLDNPKGGGVAEAYALVERAKSRALVDLLSSGVAHVRRARNSSSEVIDHLHQLRQELNWFYSKVNLEEAQGKAGNEVKVTALRELIQQHESQLLKVLRQLPAEDEEYASLHCAVSVRTERIQQSLTESQTLIEYFLVRDKVIAFLLTREGLKVISGLGDASAVKNQLDLLKYQFSKFNFGSSYVSNHHAYLQKSIDTHLSDLYESLFEPLTPELTGRDLIFVPHEFLHCVPFHALKRRDGYLIEDHSISYSPSASVFKLCSGKPPSGKASSLVMGVPDIKIPHVLDEVRDASALLSNCTLLVGAEATEEKLKSLGGEASIVHIASHGVFRNDNPMFSSIYLGSSSLSLFDIYNIELDADLVTLSGCGTGMNRIVGGDELVGLVRGFLYAGARSLLVSLWNVYDRSTAELMQAFYKYLKHNKNIAQSLCFAMRDIKEKYSHPYYWAPFILMGKTTLGSATGSGCPPGEV